MSRCSTSAADPFDSSQPSLFLTQHWRNNVQHESVARARWSQPVVPLRKQRTSRPAKRKVVISAAQRRSFRQFVASIGAGFLPVASYVLVHFEAPDRPYLYALAVAALLFSAPTVAEWACSWCKSQLKAWGFTVLLEGVMTLSALLALNLVGLAILVAINSAYAWERAKA